MNRIANVLLLSLILGVSLTATATARSDPPIGTVVQMTAGCAGADVVLSIDFNVSQVPDAGFVGWVVERHILGVCVPDAWVTEVMPWPALGLTHLDLTITPDFGYFDAIYRIWAVDAANNETFIFWPSRQSFAHADCLPGPTTIGYFVDFAGSIYFETCQESCWPSLSHFDGSYPEGAAALVGSGALMALYGELFSGMEGDFIQATAMSPSPFACGPVADEDATWGTIKAQYR